MSDRDWVGHPDLNPKGSRSNLHSQHKACFKHGVPPAGIPGIVHSKKNLRDCRTQVICPKPLVPAKLSIKAKQKGTERDRERERERGTEKQQEGGVVLLGEGTTVPSRSLVGAASREENESRRTKALLADSEGYELATALGQKY